MAKKLNKYKKGGKNDKYPLIKEGGYDIKRAIELGYEPDNTGHMPSRDYETGQYLKSPNYYTTPLSIINDELLGYKQRQDINGNLYSIPRDQQYPDFDLNNPPVRTFAKGGKIKTDLQGYWNPKNHGKPVRIPSNQITMQGVNQPLYGIDDTGFAQMMYPNQDYEFPGNSVTEFPVMQEGGNVQIKNEWEILEYDLPIAQDGKKIPLDEFIPKFANSNENIQKDIYRNANAKQQEVIQLQPVEITARRTNPLGFAGQSLKSQQTNPANVPASEVASQIFSFIPEAFHTPSRVVNYALGADNPYQSEISETLGLKNDDPTDMWTGLRNFAVDNAADFIAPELPSLGYNGLKHTVMSIDNGIDAVEPYVNSLGKTKKIFQSYNQQVNPKFINSLEQELLHTVRNTGLSLKNADDLYMPETIQKVLDRSKNLSSKQFKKLTGFEKEELLERIEKLKSGKLKKSEPVSINRESTINLQRPENYRRGRVLLPEQNVNINNTGWQSIESNLTSTTINRDDFYRPLREYNFNLNRNYIDDITTSSYKKENAIDKLNNKLQARISKKLNLAEPVEKPANTESLINYLGADKGEQAVKKQLLSAIRRVKSAGKDETFVPSNSLSTDSYPLSYKLLSSVKDDVNLNFHGMTGLNDMGFSGKVGIPKETNLKEINSVIAEINKGQSKKIPFAKIINGEIKVPIISATKKKLGGKINSSDWEIIQD